MNISGLTALPQRALRYLRYLLYLRSYERFYSADIWDGHYAGGFDLSHAKEDARYGALMVLLQRYERRGPVLDVGCGDGLLQQRFRPLSTSRLVGIDYAVRAIEHARARNLADCEFLCQDYRDYRPAEQYPVIVLNESLCYVERACDFLRQLSRHLTAEGVFLVSLFDTLVTARIWKSLDKDFASLQGVYVRDEASGQGWWIRILQPRDRVAASGG